MIITKTPFRMSFLEEEQTLKNFTKSMEVQLSQQRLTSTVMLM